MIVDVKNEVSIRCNLSSERNANMKVQNEIWHKASPTLLSTVKMLFHLNISN